MLIMLVKLKCLVSSAYKDHLILEIAAPFNELYKYHKSWKKLVKISKMSSNIRLERFIYKSCKFQTLKKLDKDKRGFISPLQEVFQEDKVSVALALQGTVWGVSIGMAAITCQGTIICLH